MYKCRRILALLLSLALVSSFFIISTSADDSSPYIMVYKRYNADGTLGDTLFRVPIAESFITPIGIYGMQIVGFEFAPSILNNQDYVTLAFRLSGFYASTSYNPLALSWPNGASFGTSDYASSIFCSYTGSGRCSEPLIFDQTIYNPSTNSAIFKLVFQTNDITRPSSTQRYTINLNNPMSIKPSGSSAGVAFWPYISDISVMIGSGLENQFYLDSLSFQSAFTSALFSSYTWQAITYNESTGNFDSTTQSGTWFDALLGSIQSLSADMQAQVAQQEKANEAGADDALDDAYDNVGSSFGSLSDFSGIGSIANWDFDSFSYSASEGLLSWFSTDTRDDIDTVPRTRDQNIVDFYSSHIQAIEELLP